MSAEGPMCARWPADEREARIAWARLAEPDDRRLDRLGVREDPLGTFLRVAKGDEPDHDRFRVRLAALDLDRELRTIDVLKLRLVVPGDDEWPPGLDALADPPLCLWLRGSAHLEQVVRRSVAIVGARACTGYGSTVASELAIGLAERGFAVVSGAAYGIDAAAHRGALVAGGTTVAVLAGGADRAYPAGNAALIGEIAAAGVVVSETPPGCAPTRPRFLSRNRLIAALASGTVVVEAGWRSGSLSTARHAERLMRPIGAVPGPVTSAQSAGTNEALRTGLAVCVTDADEVAELVGALGDDLAPPRETPVLVEDDLDEDERRVLAALPVRRAVGVDRVCTAAGLTVAEVSRALGKLALLGLAEPRPDGGWRLAPRSV